MSQDTEKIVIQVNVNPIVRARFESDVHPTLKDTDQHFSFFSDSRALCAVAHNQRVPLC